MIDTKDLDLMIDLLSKLLDDQLKYIYKMIELKDQLDDVDDEKDVQLKDQKIKIRQLEAEVSGYKTLLNANYDVDTMVKLTKFNSLLDKYAGDNNAHPNKKDMILDSLTKPHVVEKIINYYILNGGFYTR